MSTPDDYRAMAEECARWARQAQTEDKRQAYLDVARTWLEAASGQDCGPPAQTPTLWPLKPVGGFFPLEQLTAACDQATTGDKYSRKHLVF